MAAQGGLIFLWQGGGTTTNQTVTATLTTTATVTKRVNFSLSAATLTTTASITKSVGKSVTATVATAMDLVKSVGKIVSATITTDFSIARALSVTITGALHLVADLSYVLPPLHDRGFDETLRAFAEEHRRKTEEKDLLSLLKIEASIIIEALKPFLK